MDQIIIDCERVKSVLFQVLNLMLMSFDCVEWEEYFSKFLLSTQVEKNLDEFASHLVCLFFDTDSLH